MRLPQAGRRTRLRDIGSRWLGYLCATILVLSLPTFSFLVPEQRAGEAIRLTSAADSQALRDRDVEAGQGDGGGVFWNRERQTVGSRFAPKSVSERPDMEQDPVVSRRAAVEFRENQKTAGSDARERLAPGTQGPDRRGRESSEERTASTLQAELSQLEDAYEVSLNYLFPGGVANVAETDNNPFKSGTEDDGDSGQDNQGGDPDVPAGDGGDPDSGGGTPDDGGGPPSDNNNGIPGDGNPDVAGPRYEILVISKYSGDGSSVGVSRAFRSGMSDFTLESGLRFEPFSSFVGSLRPIFVAQTSEQLLVDSYFTELFRDAFVVQSSPDGSGLFALSYDMATSWDLKEATFARYQEVRLGALFDIDGDGEEEWVIGLKAGRALVVYDFSDEGISYSKKIALPFAPGSLAHTGVKNAYGENFLHVFDTEFKQSISFNTLVPGIPTYSVPPTYRKIVRIRLDSVLGPMTGPAFIVVHYSDRIVVLADGPVPVQVASIPMVGQVPTILVGEVFEPGNWQVLWVP